MAWIPHEICRIGPLLNVRLCHILCAHEQYHPSRHLLYRRHPAAALRTHAGARASHAQQLHHPCFAAGADAALYPRSQAERGCGFHRGDGMDPFCSGSRIFLAGGQMAGAAAPHGGGADADRRSGQYLLPRPADDRGLLRQGSHRHRPDRRPAGQFSGAFHSRHHRGRAVFFRRTQRTDHPATHRAVSTFHRADHLPGADSRGLSRMVHAAAETAGRHPGAAGPAVGRACN